MSPVNPDWPALLQDYQAAIAEFDRVSSALTVALTERSPAEDDFRALVVAEERARETVVLARMRLMNLWRESGAELEHKGLTVPAAPDAPQ